LVLFVVGNAGAAVAVPISVAVTLTLLFEATYGVYREERQMRAERESEVRVAVIPSSWAFNYPDPGPDKVSLRVHVILEVWVKEDVSTDKLALNLIYVYDKPWWKFWKKTRFPKEGIRPNGQDGTQYRRKISADDRQPYRDDGLTFEYVGNRGDKGDPHWLLELVLITGMPVGEHRIPVFIDEEELRSRGAKLTL